MSKQLPGAAVICTVKRLPLQSLITHYPSVVQQMQALLVLHFLIRCRFSSVECLVIL